MLRLPIRRRNEFGNCSNCMQVLGRRFQFLFSTLHVILPLSRTTSVLRQGSGAQGRCRRYHAFRHPMPANPAPKQTEPAESLRLCFPLVVDQSTSFVVREAVTPATHIDNSAISWIAMTVGGAKQLKHVVTGRQIVRLFEKACWKELPSLNSGASSSSGPPP